MYALGIDFGTNSVRALIADLETGKEVGTYVHNYTRGVDGIILDESDPNFARQDPREYVEGLEASVRGAIREAERVSGFSAEKIIGIGIDTTGSTPIPVDSNGMPLSFNKKFADNPNAYAWLWKDHTSHEEASIITEKARESSIDYTKYSGGVYSSEWFFSKILHLANTDPKVYEAASSFVEHCDWMPALIVGNTNPKCILRSRCAAGHKAMWNAEWGGLPPQEFWSAVSPKLDGIVDKLYSDTYTANTKVGGLCKEWASKLGLQKGIAVAVGAFDAHMGAVGAGIKPGTLVKIMGTSTCDMMVVPAGELNTQIKGICGQVDGSIVPGMIGLEAGQSAVGDIFAWYRDQIRWGVENLLPSDLPDLANMVDTAKKTALDILTKQASKLRPGQSGLLALDWFNGNRTVLVDPNLTGMIVGLTLGTKPEEIFMALIEATAFGGKVIMERFQEYGIEVADVIACGGLAERNPFLMQIYADVTGRPMKVSRSSQTCALGSAMFGAVAAGYFSNVEEAQAKMSQLKDIVYKPNPKHRKTYDALFSLYCKLHDSFGTPQHSENLFSVMKELLEIKRSVV
ncbi:MAG: ribulokinase [Firmicutes bacterium]|nr:ribulokinase [Bacillota bacterium]